MAKEKPASLEWFGADVEESDDGKTTASYLGGYVGVDADVPGKVITHSDGRLERAIVRKPAPRHVTVKTTAKDAKIAKLTSRWKLMRSAFQFAPLVDKEMWETRERIAFCEMQIERISQKLVRYQKQMGESANPEQVRVYKNKVYQYRGQLAELLGQE